MGIVDKIMTLVREIEGCGMIMERVGGLRSGVPAPKEWSVLRTFRTRSLPLLALNRTFCLAMHVMETNDHERGHPFAYRLLMKGLDFLNYQS